MGTTKLRSMIFIDGTNLDHQVSQYCKNDLDFRKLLTYLAAGTDLKQAFYFTAPYKPGRGQERYNRQLRTFNNFKNIDKIKLIKDGKFQTRVWECKRCKLVTSGVSEKGTDVALAATMVQMTFTNQADCIILVSNDNDYAPALKICKTAKVETRLFYVESDATSWNKVAQLRHQVVRSEPLTKVILDTFFLPRP